MNNDIINHITKRVLILIAVFSIISFFAFEEFKPIILGLLFGGIVSILNFRLLENSVSRAMTMAPGKASSYSFRHYMIRYLIAFMVLLVAALADYLNIISAMLGLILVKIVIIIDYTFFNKLQDKKKL